MYGRYWREKSEETTITIPGYQSMSYFSDKSNVCWFLEAELAKEIVRVHDVVGNAVTKGSHIVVGTGSSQLYLAALYALSSSHDSPHPIPVLSALPYYSVSLSTYFIYLSPLLFNQVKSVNLVESHLFRSQFDLI